jgi:hypothetical protein
VNNKTSEFGRMTLTGGVHLNIFGLKRQGDGTGHWKTKIKVGSFPRALSIIERWK